MDSIDHLVNVCGGVVSARQLVEAGMTRDEIRKFPGLRRLRHGWYSSGKANPHVESAVVAGGALACVSVLRLAGVWTPDNELHVRYSEHRATRTTKNCHPYRRNPPVLTAVDSLELAVESAASCLDPEGVVVVLDSMLNKGMIEMADVRAITEASRHQGLALADRCDATSESGIETMTRLRLELKGIKVQTQVWVTGVDRVDILIGKCLIIECDGEEHHRAKFESDRERDRMLSAMGYIVVRLTYNHVVHDWDASLRDILTIIRRRDHLRAPNNAA